MNENGYEKFASYSPLTQKRIIDFTQVLISWIEIFNGYEIPFPNHLKDGFSGKETLSLLAHLEEIIPDFKIDRNYNSNWDGPMSNRVEKPYLIVGASDDAVACLKKFLGRVVDDYKNTLRISEGALMPTQFTVKIKDREIWVNDYLLSKPHGAGINMQFFEHIYRNAGVVLERSGFPKLTQKEIGKKKTSQILNQLGFKGEILKAFFPKRAKTVILFRKTITENDLESAGLKRELLDKELNLAHAKNSLK